MELSEHPRGAIAAWLLTILTVGYVLWMVTYHFFFDPLRQYPGPKLRAFTRIPNTRMALSGRVHEKVLELHKQYGPVVRMAPDTLSFCHPDAWLEIRGHRKSGLSEHGKDPIHQYTQRHNIIGANRENHGRFRRMLSHGFSAQSMLKQQPIIKEYIDTLFHKLHEECAGGTQPVDIVKWYNFTTFDIIGDLGFGEPFGCLHDSTYHPWVSLIFDNVKAMAFASNMARYPAISKLLMYLVPSKLKKRQAEHIELSRVKVRKRMELATARPDFIGSMIAKSQELTFDEIASNASILIIAGSETTATGLSGATYYLASQPETLARLVDEVRSHFNNEGEIDLISVQNLPYMQAVIDETLRVFPPAPAHGPRKIAPEGDYILGNYVPGGTIAEIWQWSTYHNPNLFTLPDSFIPERWLGDPRFVNDKKEACNPFSVGPRNCIGKNLAYAEMRLILARMVWNFDIKLVDGYQGWDRKCNLYLLWEKAPLRVYLTPRAIR